MKKSLLALAGITLALVFGTGVLYSVGNGTQEVTVQLPENKSGEFELLTVADGKQCMCKYYSYTNHKSDVQRLKTFHTADNCEKHCEDDCNTYLKRFQSVKFEETYCE